MSLENNKVSGTPDRTCKLDQNDQTDKENNTTTITPTMENKIQATKSNDSSPTSTSRANKPRALDLTKNHRKALSTNDLESIGLRIVSPGLPPLNSKMSRMVLKSKSIELQQKKLIARRTGAGELVDEEEEEGDELIVVEDDDGDDEIQQQSIVMTSSNSGSKKLKSKARSHNEEGEDIEDDLVIPSPKRLKREKLPTPLTINRPNIPNPLVNSAPLARNTRRVIRYPLSHHQHHQLQLQQQQQQLVALMYHHHHQQQQYQRLYPMYYSPYMPPSQYAFPGQHALLPYQHRYQAPVTTAPYEFPRPRVHFQNRNGGYSSPLQSITPTTASTSTTTTSTSGSGSGSSEGPKPVIDVYPTGVMKELPNVAQPLSAQREKFPENDLKKLEISETAEEKSDEVELVETTTTASANIVASIDGELKMNNDIFYYNLTTSKDLKQDRDNFLKICATAWDEFAKLL